MQATDISLAMDTAGSKARYDSAAKRLLSYKAVIAWVLKYAAREFRDLDVAFIAKNCISGVSVSEKAVHMDHPDRLPEDAAEMMNSESSSITEGKILYDLRLMARVPETSKDVFLMVNMEMQNNGTLYALVTRGIYYCARMISEQYGTVFTDMDYQKIQKVYSIWICPNPAEKRENSIVRYTLREEEVLGKGFMDRKDYDKLEVVVINLGKDAGDSENPAVGLLSTLFSSDMSLEERKEILERRYGIPMTKEFESEVTQMCNLSEGIEERGRRKGIAEGSIMTLFDLVNDGLLSLETASAKANMTTEEFLEKKKKLGK